MTRGVHVEINDRVKERTRRLQDLMGERSIDAAIILKPENVFYFSNFNPILNSHPVFLVVPKKGEASLLVHALRDTHARNDAAMDKILLYGKWGGKKTLADTPEAAVAALLDDKIDSVGFERDTLSMAMFGRLKSKVEFREDVDIGEMIQRMKIIKDAYEIECIRAASRLVDTGVGTTLEWLASGVTEAEACTEGQYAMRKTWQKEFPDYEVSGFGTSEGGMIDSLHCWCLSNERIAYGCDCPKPYRPKRGDMVLPMAWAKINGYHAENERSIVMGELSADRQKAYDAMLEARQNVFDILKPGALFEELYEAACGAFRRHGFGGILPGRIGHGIGNSAHEFVSLTKGNKMPLAEGMAITVEPGLMDAWGGARHSDTVIITEKGYERLTASPNRRIRIENGKVLYESE